MFSLFIVSWTVVSLAYLSKIMCSKVPTSLVIYRFIQDDHSRKLIKHSLFFCFPVTWSNVIHALIFFHSRFSIHTWIGCWHSMLRMSSPAHLKTSRCYIKHNLILLCFPSLFMFQGKLVYHLVEKQWLKNIQRSLTVSLIQTCRVKTSYTVGLKMARMLHQTHGPQSLLPVPCLSNQPAKPIPVCTSALRKHLTQVAWLPTLGPKYSWMFNVSNGWSNFAHLIYFFLSSSWSGSVCWFKMNIWLTRYFDDFLFYLIYLRYPYGCRNAGHRGSTRGLWCPVAVYLRWKPEHFFYKLDATRWRPAITFKVCCAGKGFVTDTGCSTHRRGGIRLHSL